MRSVGIKVLKNKLSEYVRLAASGETVLVTDRDRVVAELVPPRKGIDKADAKAKWAEAGAAWAYHAGQRSGMRHCRREQTHHELRGD